jgi:ABC-type nitrate/sulfonate/bicarbonate transport system substrate-binding protein
MRLSRRTFLRSAAAASALPLLPGLARAGSPLIFQASWSNDAEFAGYFLAMDQGYYSAGGLDLTYLPGGPDVIPESTLVAGKADLALTTPDTTVSAITDQGAKFKIIGAQYQKNPVGIVSLAKAPIKTPADMIGKTIAVPPVNTISVEAMLAMNNIDKSKVNIVPYEYDPTPLIKGEIDASLDFVTNVPYTIKTMGEESFSFLLYDFGYTIYNDTVVVTEDTLKTKRKELVAWLKASRQGWTENLADPAAWPPKWEKTWFNGTGRTIDNEVFYNTAQKPLMETDKGIFAMTEAGIAANVEALGKVGIKATKDMFDASLLEEAAG